MFQRHVKNPRIYNQYSSLNSSHHTFSLKQQIFSHSTSHKGNCTDRHVPTFQAFKGICGIGLQSLAFVWDDLVFGIGEVLPWCHSCGIFPCSKHKLKICVNSRINTSNITNISSLYSKHNCVKFPDLLFFFFFLPNPKRFSHSMTPLQNNNP